MAKILVIHGPNLNLLGQREVDVYGRVTIDEINGDLRSVAEKEGIELEILQSSHEGERYILERTIGYVSPLQSSNFGLDFNFGRWRPAAFSNKRAI